MLIPLEGGTYGTQTTTGIVRHLAVQAPEQFGAVKAPVLLHRLDLDPVRIAEYPQEAACDELLFRHPDLAFPLPFWPACHRILPRYSLGILPPIYLLRLEYFLSILLPAH